MTESLWFDMSSDGPWSCGETMKTLVRGSFPTGSVLLQTAVSRTRKQEGQARARPCIDSPVLPLGDHYLLLLGSDSGHKFAEVYAVCDPPTVGGAAVPGS